MKLPCGIFSRDYSQEMAIVRTKTQWFMTLAFIIFLMCFPLFASGKLLNLAILISITVIAVHGLNILSGYCGQLSLGHAAFMMVGAYTSAILCVRLGWPFWAALPCAGISAGLIGLIFGLPSMRVKGFYLALVTIAAQFIITWIIFQSPESFAGGADGMPAPAPTIGGITLDSMKSYYWMVMPLTMLMTLFAKNLVRTRVGRSFVAIRDNDLAAEVMGVNIYRYKLLAFFIGCFFAGFAGSLWGHYMGRVHADHYTFMNSIWFLGMIIVGGMGSTAGTIFGVVSLRVLDELIIMVSPAIARAIPAISLQLTTSLGLIIFSAVILLFLIFEPRGLAHRWEIIKSYYRIWPFSY